MKSHFREGKEALLRAKTIIPENSYMSLFDSMWLIEYEANAADGVDMALFFAGINYF